MEPYKSSISFLLFLIKGPNKNFIDHIRMIHFMLPTFFIIPFSKYGPCNKKARKFAGKQHKYFTYGVNAEEKAKISTKIIIPSLMLLWYVLAMAFLAISSHSNGNSRSFLLRQYRSNQLYVHITPPYKILAPFIIRK
jgi:hypothetical protein